MKVVLLAAGIGQRLQPITDHIPKPMIKIAGKPILEYILEDLLNFGFNDFLTKVSLPLCPPTGVEAKGGKSINLLVEYFDPPYALVAFTVC